MEDQPNYRRGQSCRPLGQRAFAGDRPLQELSGPRKKLLTRVHSLASESTWPNRAVNRTCRARLDRNRRAWLEYRAVTAEWRAVPQTSGGGRSARRGRPIWDLRMTCSTSHGRRRSPNLAYVDGIDEARRGGLTIEWRLPRKEAASARQDNSHDER